jgi:hypothetical protein
MHPLTPTQQQALITYKETGELGILSNLLIEHCLEELMMQQKAYRNYSRMAKFIFVFVDFEPFESNGEEEPLFYTGGNDDVYDKFGDLNVEYQKIITETLLSRTPDGQAVMPFLDVETKETMRFIGQQEHHTEDTTMQLFELLPKTLDHLLYREFTEALRIGKTPDQALLEITKDYINHFYL